MKARAIILGVLAALLVQGAVVASSAFADHDHGRHGGHYKHDRGWHHGQSGYWREGRWYYARPYYYEPYVYYAPPPVYYPPPPPSVGFNLIFPFRIH